MTKATENDSISQGLLKFCGRRKFVFYTGFDPSGCEEEGRRWKMGNSRGERGEEKEGGGGGGGGGGEERERERERERNE